MIWAGLVTLAAVLVGQDSEAAKRSAINRAYFGVFNEARRLLEARGIPIERHRSHAQVIHAFKDAGGAALDADEKWLQVGEWIKALRVLRNRADYEDEFPRLERKATDAVEIAQRTLVLLDELEIS